MSGGALRCLAAATLIASLGVTAGADAQEKTAVVAAAEAYDAGVEAHRQKDYARAAALFARADELAPDPAARLAGLKSALLADDPVLGMTLAARAARAGAVEGPLADAVKAVRDRYAGRVGRIRVSCTGCSASLDGAPVAVGEELTVLRGEHRVELGVQGRVEARSVLVDAPDPIDVSPALAGAAQPASPAAPVASAPARTSAPRVADAPGGISPAWLILGAGVTAVAGGLTIASGVDVRNRESDFYAAPTEQKAADGQVAETRTYVLGAVTATAGIATIALALFAVRWNRTAARVGAGRAGAWAELSSSF